MRTRAARRYNRAVKGRRRIREDRAQHGADRHCPCFDPEADRARGKTFSRFADYPKASGCVCCGNPRRHYGNGAVTIQELRAPRAEDWG